MALKSHLGVEVTADLIESIRSFPVERDVEHCGTRFVAPPFDLYADCPQCGTRIKVRSFSGMGEVEDVFEWMNQPTAEVMAERRRAVLKDED